MIKKGHTIPVQENEHMRGGDGTVILHHFLNQDEFYGKGRLFSHITVNPGCSVGYHEHHGETEIYAVLSGNGVFNDNGEEAPVTAGDVMITKGGQGHGVACAGSCPLELIALIIYE
ncbi:MAG: cupin domain-containing protein [Clostridiales bacterium]|nr:MAG: cupin domain-containing protein [Clostridiales bacterium]